jgi:hypothetical protein
MLQSLYTLVIVWSLLSRFVRNTHKTFSSQRASLASVIILLPGSLYTFGA